MPKKVFVLMQVTTRKTAESEDRVETPIGVVIAQSPKKASEILGGTLEVFPFVTFSIEQLEKNEAWEKTTDSGANILTFTRKDAPDIMLVFKDGVMTWGDRTETYRLNEVSCLP